MRLCPECGSKKLEHSHDGLVCRDCGIVIEDGIYSGERMIV